MLRALDVGTSLAATLARGGTGIAVGTLGKRPAKPVQLYEFEGCPYCRKVREALTILDLEADVFPCPKSGTRFRPKVVKEGGKAQFPYLVDPNAKVALYESDDIVRHLFREYGNGRVPALLALGPVTLATSALAGAARLGLGTYARPSRRARVPLELWSFEGSPFSRLAREALCTLELPYRLHNVGRGSPSRRAFVERSGKMQVPYLADPNTGVEMFESADIVAYLDRTYGGSGS
jgi:glutathione S-transferase